MRHATSAPTKVALTLITPAALVILAGQAFAQPPARTIPIIPPKQTTPAPSTQPASQPTIPTNIGGQTVNLTPQDAASYAAWQDRLRTYLNAQGTKAPLFDASMGEAQTKLVQIPIAGGKSTGILALPAGAEVGVWLTNGPLAQPADNKSTLASQLAAPQKPTDGPPRINTAEMTPANIADAMKKYPASDGWQVMWIGDAGKIFVKANACEAASIAGALGAASRNDSLDRPAFTDTVTDYGHRLQGLVLNDNDQTGKVSDVNGKFLPAKPPAPAAALKAPDAATSGKDGSSAHARYTIAPDRVDDQAASIRGAQAIAQDQGRLERALAITEMAQPGVWSEGVRRLGAAYLSHPSLLNTKISEDFSDVSDAALTKMLGHAVADANRENEPKLWAAVAAIMVEQSRPALATQMIDRARKVAADDTMLADVNELGRGIEQLSARVSKP